MKYIRTKDGRIIDLSNWSKTEVISVDSESKETNKDICYQRSWFVQDGDACQYKTEYISHNYQVLKQADTIEELGDAYVIVPKNKKYKPCIEYTLSVFDDFEDVLRHNDIYLSIWVNALLKPVAKMNNKGELELL